MKKRSNRHLRQKKHNKYFNHKDTLIHAEELLRQNHKHTINLAFNIFAKRVSDVVGNAWSFMFALLIIIFWGLSGYFFKFSDTWQLVINTGTTIITFLIVFLIQNTQNRDTEILNLKLDELIRSNKNAQNPIIDLSELSDVELKELEKEYIKLVNRKTGR